MACTASDGCRTTACSTRRYFRAGTRPLVFEAGGVGVGVTVCEDLWGDGGPVAQASAEGARVVLNVNASPYSRGKRAERERWAARHVDETGVWLAYLKQVGGQGEVVFDGDSGPAGMWSPAARSSPPACWSSTCRSGTRPPAQMESPRLDPVAEVDAALVLGTRDYVRKNGFSRALVGLSGGIDSALVAAIAADALGPAAVTGWRCRRRTPRRGR